MDIFFRLKKALNRPQKVFYRKDSLSLEGVLLIIHVGG